MEAAHLVGIGGAIGAILRYGVGLWLAHDRFPFSTLFVNVVGSFVLGIVVFVGAGEDVVLLLGVGACGAFTTYSSFSVETVQLWEDGSHVRATVYAIGTFGCCLGAVGLAAGFVWMIELWL